MRTYFQEFETDDGAPVMVEYDYEDRGNCVCIKESWREPEDLGDVAIDVKLTDKERERMEAWLMEHRYWPDHDNGGEP